MRKKFFTALALAVVIIAIILVALPIHALFSLHFSEAGNTTSQLEKLLDSLEWDREYEANVFDCSNMAARLCEELRAEGFKCVLAIDNGHVWVMVRTMEGIQNVESINLSITASGRTPWYAMHPSLSKLVSPLAEFSYEEETLIAKPEITPEPTPNLEWDDWITGNDTLNRKEVEK